MTAAASSPEAAGGHEAQQPERPDVFISYSRADTAFVQRLAAKLEGRGLDVWVDWEDIRKGADWRAKVHAGIDSARTVVPVLTDSFAQSTVCADEIEHAVENNKRLVPVVLDTVDGTNLRAELTAPNWIVFDPEAEYEARVDELVDAVGSDPEWLDQHARLLVRAREWRRESENPSFLLRGTDLDAAEAWIATQGSHRESPTPLHGDYIVASRRAARRRQRVTIGAILVALAVAIVLALAAVWQWREAVAQSAVSRSRELASSATAQLPTDPELSVALAREAVAADETPEAVDALRTALAESHVVRTLRGHRSRIVAGDVADGTGRLITGSADRTGRIWSTATGEPVAVLRGHRQPLQHVELSRDGAVALTVAADGTARTWDASGRPLAVARVGGKRVRARLSPDARTLVASAGGSDVALRDARTGDVVRRLRGVRGSVESVAFDAKGTRVAAATGDDDGVARIWDVRTGRLLQQLSERSTIDRDENVGLEQIAFNPSGRRLAAVTTEFGIVVWDLATGRKVMTGGGFESSLSVTTMAFSPNGRLLAAGTLDGVTAVWQVSGGVLVSTLRGHEQQITSVSFDPQSRLVATASIDGTARVWRARTGEEVAWLRGHEQSIWSVEFGSDGRRVATTSHDATARVWNADVEGGGAVLRGHGESLREAVFSPEGTRIATAGEDARARLWDGRTLQPLAWLEHDDEVRHVEFSPDGDRLLTSGPDGVRVWDAADGRRLAILRGHRDNVDAAHFSGDGTTIVTASLDSTGGLWDSGTGRRRAVLRGHGDAVYDAALSPDGELAATASGDGTVRLWNARSGRRLRVLQQQPAAWHVAFTPDGRVLATSGENGTVRLWDVENGRRLRELDSGQADEIRFSPDGTVLLVAGLDSVVELWRVADGQPLVRLRGHRSQVVWGSFSHDGTNVVTVALDNSVRVWEVATGEQRARFNVIGSAQQAAFAPDGRTIIAAGSDGTAQIFDCRTCGSLDVLLAAAARARPLTPAERRRYLHE